MFVHLHTHSHYSLLDGLAKIPELVDRAKEENMNALALTDHGVMYGAIEFWKYAKSKGIKPIIGVEVYVARNSRLNKRPRIDEKPYHLVLLAKDKEGYQNLVKLTTLAHLEGFYYKPRIDWELLEKYHKGLIALTACLKGEIPSLILVGKKEEAGKTALKYKNLFGEDNFYLELQHHPNLPEQEVVNRELIRLGKKLNIPLIATNDIHYLDLQDAEAQDVLLCLQMKKKKEDKNRLCMLSEDFSFRGAEQMEKAFKEVPEAIENTEKIAQRCNLELELGKVTLPSFEVPGNQTVDEYLKILCYKGLEKRYDIKFPISNFQFLNKSKIQNLKSKTDKEILERLEYELSVIEKTGFASYFLIVQDFVNWAKSQGIVVGPGRGSAAGSIVSFLLNITNIDPLKYDLFFERFLNPERIAMPDIDLDFTDTRRDEVIRYVEEKYGKDHVAQIITFGTMAARAAVRDVGRVLGFPYNYCDRLAKMIPMFSTLNESLKISPELKETYKNEAGVRKIIDTAKKLEGVARHASTHACGVVITPEPLDFYTPRQYATSSDKTIVVQYSLHSIEDLGLLKMDFLGLKNLTVLENAIEIIEKTKGVKIKIDEIPLQDKKTFGLFREGETIGVFQLESSGMRKYLKELKPTTMEDIIAMVALYRPGPIEWIPDFIQGKQKNKKISYLHPKLKPILERTYGVVVYQEQVLQIARDLAGFTLGEADILRKAVGKKIPKLLEEQKEKFIGGCIARGILKTAAQKIFAFIEPFAGYGFNRAHAACYALIAYETAYLKANWPAEFMASLLTSDLDDIDRIAIEVEECKRLGIEVLPPDINESFSTFTVVASSLKEKMPKIRFGLKAIKNVGGNIAKAIIHERKTNGHYKNLEDFLRRIKSKDLNKKSLESLIKCGALDKFGERNQMLGSVERLLKFLRYAQKESKSNQGNLFENLTVPLGQEGSLHLEERETASKDQKLTWEKELLGLYVSEHPFKEFEFLFKDVICPCGKINPRAIPVSWGDERGKSPYQHIDGEGINVEAKNLARVAGVITKVQKIITRGGELMLFVKIEDSTGNLEVLVFPTVYKLSPALFKEGKIIFVSGRVSEKEEEIKFIANEVQEITIENVPELTRTFKSKGDISTLGGKIHSSFISKPLRQISNFIYPHTKNFGAPPPPKEYPNAVPTKLGWHGVYISLPPIVKERLLEELRIIFSSHPGEHKVCLVVTDRYKTKKIETNFNIDYNKEVKERIEKTVGLDSVKCSLD